MTASDVLTKLQGKKTYIVLGVGAVAIILNHFGLWPESLPLGVDPNDWIGDLWSLILGGTFRAAIPKG